MRRLLLVAYHFPPEPAAGARRPELLAKYLPEFGWAVTVLTRALAQRAAVSTPYEIAEAGLWGESFERSVRTAVGGSSSTSPGGKRSRIRSALASVRDAVVFPDRVAGWIFPAAARARELCRSTRFDAVASTAMPASAHVAGALIAAQNHLPWLADYRDPWSGNHMRPPRGIRGVLDRTFERALLKRAGDVTAVPTIVPTVESVLGRPVRPLANAYDPDDFAALAGVEPDGFVLCHTGSLYDGLISPALCFETLGALRAQGHPAARARVEFYGPYSDHVGAVARQYGVEDLVEEHGLVSRPQALAAQRHASTLLVFLKMDESTSHVLGSKVIEYAGARRPVIAFGPKTSAMREFLRRSGLGWFASNRDEAIAALSSAYDRFAAGERDVVATPGSVIEARELASVFANRLDRIVR